MGARRPAQQAPWWVWFGMFAASVSLVVWAGVQR